MLHQHTVGQPRFPYRIYAQYIRATRCIVLKCALIHPANMMEKALVERKMTCGLCYSNTLWAKFCPTYVIYTVSVLATRSIVQ